MLRTLLLALAAAQPTADLAPRPPGPDRMPPIPAERMTPEQSRAVEAFRAQRGEPVMGPFIPLLRSPELMERSRALGDYLRFRALPPRLSELAILVVAKAWDQSVEWRIHAPLALKAGIAPETVTALHRGARPRGLDPEARVVWEVSRRLHARRAIPDALHAEAVARLGEKGLVDLVGINGYYAMLAMQMNTARTPAP